MSEPYRADNLLDRVGDDATRQIHYDHQMERERALLDAGTSRSAVATSCRWAAAGTRDGTVPVPRVANDRRGAERRHDRRLPRAVSSTTAWWARAGELSFEPASFDVVLYRLVLHHVIYQGPLGPVFAEAARLLRPGGAIVAVEPGLWHPVGAGLALANRAGSGRRCTARPTTSRSRRAP